MEILWQKVLKFMFAGFENLFYLGWRGGVLLETCEKVVPEIFLLKMMQVLIYFDAENKIDC